MHYQASMSEYLICNIRFTKHKQKLQRDANNKSLWFHCVLVYFKVWQWYYSAMVAVCGELSGWMVQYRADHQSLLMRFMSLAPTCLTRCSHSSILRHSNIDLQLWQRALEWCVINMLSPTVLKKYFNTSQPWLIAIIHKTSEDMTRKPVSS